MNKKLKLALATLLGFSAACSTAQECARQGRGRTATGSRSARSQGFGCAPARDGDVRGSPSRTENDRRAAQGVGGRPCRRRAARPRSRETRRRHALYGHEGQEGSRRGEVTHVPSPPGAAQASGPQYFFRPLLLDCRRAQARYALLGMYVALQPLVPPLRQRLPRGSRCAGHADRRFSEGARRGGYAPCRPCAGARHLFGRRGAGTPRPRTRRGGGHPPRLCVGHGDQRAGADRIPFPQPARCGAAYGLGEPRRLRTRAQLYPL